MRWTLRSLRRAPSLQRRPASSLLRLRPTRVLVAGGASVGCFTGLPGCTVRTHLHRQQRILSQPGEADFLVAARRLGRTSLLHTSAQGHSDAVGRSVFARAGGISQTEIGVVEARPRQTSPAREEKLVLAPEKEAVPTSTPSVGLHAGACCSGIGLASFLRPFWAISSRREAAAGFASICVCFASSRRGIVRKRCACMLAVLV